MILIGLDAASDRRKFGYAIGRTNGVGAEIIESGCLQNGTIKRNNAIVEALALADGPALLAIDAPLGWPDGLRFGLHGHAAGQHFEVGKELTFRRRTEIVLRSDRYRASPLEVGADRIARAAHEALSVLNELRTVTRLPLPLVWTPGGNGVGVIEVYPAATLRAHGMPSKGYKLPEQIGVRRQIAAKIDWRLAGLNARCDGNADEFDACLCLLAALDFVNGECLAPPDEFKEVIAREGWIWVRENWREESKGKSER